MNIRLEKLNQHDFEALFKFEQENKVFFEKMVPPRPDNYFVYDQFKKNNQALLAEQETGKSHFFLIKDQASAIHGRLNIVDIDLETQTGDLGYRIGESSVGKGVASQALALLLGRIDELPVIRLEAKTTSHNLASQRVLEKNGFTYQGADANDFEMNGERVNFVYYTWSKD
ncbi:GNAT family N-acetyltransferase [Amphibacillus cookii]|uniref:GNAT family N-acetyltransferase n=1 Tax=Amphibacillus cookii TaxID=767787 RepID=UPI00195A7830|nr:GNAT family N-acetyltransferase [Amphibacillus cookii]MBM7542659.1 ribosomal-protein-alanine N-acetyltransferase [Amphibacillus cookii]